MFIQLFGFVFISSGVLEHLRGHERAKGFIEGSLAAIDLIAKKQGPKEADTTSGEQNELNKL